MPDSVYDKLGDLLNDALESGEIPQNENNKIESDEKISFNSTGCDSSEHVRDNSTLFNFNNSKNNKIYSDKVQNATIFKREQLNITPMYPEQILKDLLLFGIQPSYNNNLKQIKKRYRDLLKSNHPDQSASNYSEQNTQTIIEVYNRLSNYFTK